MRATLLAALSLCLAPLSAEAGQASYYAHAHHGKRTANGERFNMRASTCAHRTARFGTIFRVTYKGRSANCRVNDRGPAGWTRREIDLSLAVASAIGLVARGHGPVSIQQVR